MNQEWLVITDEHGEIGSVWADGLLDARLAAQVKYGIPDDADDDVVGIKEDDNFIVITKKQ